MLYDVHSQDQESTHEGQNERKVFEAGYDGNNKNGNEYEEQ
jgi:hypothetical protein